MSKRTPNLLNYWLYFAVAIFFGVVAVYSLRANNLGAIRLRNQVLAVDKANGDVEAALRELRTYVYSHMNANLSSGTNVYPPVQLKYRYDRLVSAEKERVAAQTTKVYTEAQKHCERKNSTDFSGRNRVPCIEAYVTSRSVTERPINQDLYKFDFASPAWTPDVAGISLLLAGITGLMGIISFLGQLWLRNRLL